LEEQVVACPDARLLREYDLHKGDVCDRKIIHQAGRPSKIVGSVSVQFYLE
jgi:hypothetical protein